MFDARTVGQWEMITSACLSYMTFERDIDSTRLSFDKESPCIICIGSFADRKGFDGLEHLVQSMATDYRDAGIRVHLVAPGKMYAFRATRESDQVMKLYLKEDSIPDAVE